MKCRYRNSPITSQPQWQSPRNNNSGQDIAAWMTQGAIARPFHGSAEPFKTKGSSCTVTC